MERRGVIAAGILLYRRQNEEIEILLVHPGGSYGAGKDLGIWSFPKGEADNGETTRDELLLVALREFHEEMGFPCEGECVYLGYEVRERDNKLFHIWVVEGDCDVTALNSAMLESPKGSGNYIPEVDQAEFFPITLAKEKLNPYLRGFIAQFEKFLQDLK